MPGSKMTSATVRIVDENVLGGLIAHSGWGEATQARINHEKGWPVVLGFLEAYFGK